MNRNLFFTILILLGFGIFAYYKYSGKKPYNEKYDNLVHGLYFGMDKKEFFDHCWELNQKGKTQHGTVDNNVMYIDSLNFDENVVVNFYPDFEDEKIARLPMSFYYSGWAPWNKKQLSQSRLLDAVIDHFENLYGEGFERREAKNGNSFHVKFEGPLMIRVYKDIDEMIVKADISNKYYPIKSSSDK